MILSRRYLQMVTCLFIFFLACFATSQETEKKLDAWGQISLLLPYLRALHHCRRFSPSLASDQAREKVPDEMESRKVCGMCSGQECAHPVPPMHPFSSKRAVTEHQLLHDRGRILQGLKRLMWLHNTMGEVHTANSRDISQAHIMWTSPKNQDLPHFQDSTGREETPDVMKQLLLGLLEKDSPFAALKKTNVLRYLKNIKGGQDLQDHSDLFQVVDQDSKRNLSAQT